MSVKGQLQLAVSWGSETAYPSPGSLWLKREGANSMPPGSPPLAAICRGVGPLLYAGVPACGLIATPTNRDRRRRREPKAGGIVRENQAYNTYRKGRSIRKGQPSAPTTATNGRISRGVTAVPESRMEGW